MCLATLLGEAPSLLLKSQMGVASCGVPRTQQGLAHSVCRNDDGPEALKVNDINHRQSPTPSTLVPMLPAPLCEPSCRGAPGRPQGASAVTPGGVKVGWSLSCLVPSLQTCPWMPVCSPEARGMPGLSPLGQGRQLGRGVGFPWGGAWQRLLGNGESALWSQSEQLRGSPS